MGIAGAYTTDSLRICQRSWMISSCDTTVDVWMRRPFGKRQQWQQLPQRLAAGRRRIVHATAGELKRLPAQLRQQRRALLAEDRTDRGSRPAFRPTNNLVLNPLANWVSAMQCLLALARQQLYHPATPDEYLLTPGQIVGLLDGVNAPLHCARDAISGRLFAP